MSRGAGGDRGGSTEGGEGGRGSGGGDRAEQGGGGAACPVWLLSNARRRQATHLVRKKVEVFHRKSLKD